MHNNGEGDPLFLNVRWEGRELTTITTPIAPSAPSVPFDRTNGNPPAVVIVAFVGAEMVIVFVSAGDPLPPEVNEVEVKAAVKELV